MTANPPSVVISNAENPPPLLPCPYRTGKKLGQGSYATVKEAIEIETGKKFAAKIINKEFMAGKEMIFINELNILKKNSRVHPNLVTLHSYFETPLNWYLIMDLCEGGELFERLYEKGTFYEKDAIHVIKQVLEGIAYLHDNDIVHRDIKAENIMFRTKAEDSEIVIADFGLSRFINDKDKMLQTVCGTQGYMAPEIILHKKYGKPVDMWAIGVLTFIILSGYCPFSGETVAEENNNIIHCNYEFEPEDFWKGISENAKDFIRKLLVYEPELRMTAHEALQHDWIVSKPVDEVNLLPTVRDNIKKKFRKAVIAINVVNRLRSPQNVGRPITRSPSPSPLLTKDLNKDLNKLNIKEE